MLRGFLTGIVYQAYSLNHAENDFVYETDEVQKIARRLNRTPRQVIVAMTKRLGLLPLVGPQDPIKQARALTAARYLPALLTESEVKTLENIAFLSGVNTEKLEGDDARLKLSVTNRRSSDIYLAWQTPDHSRARTQQGMHVAAARIAAGDTHTLNTFHRHGPSTFCRTLFQIERAALHSYGPDPHSC